FAQPGALPRRVERSDALRVAAAATAAATSATMSAAPRTLTLDTVLLLGRVYWRLLFGYRQGAYPRTRGPKTLRLSPPPSGAAAAGRRRAVGGPRRPGATATRRRARGASGR